MTFCGCNNYRPQTKFAKVMFSQVFVCPQGGLCPVGSLSSGVSFCGASTQGGLCRGGLCWRVSVRETPPPYGYVRAVRILLECILVINVIHLEFTFMFHHPPCIY